jgi:hypothetical protein
MARTNLAVQQIVVAGLLPTYSTANADGHSVVNNGNVFLHVKNASGSSVNVTVETPAKVGGLDVAEDVVTVGASSEKMIGPFDPSVFNQSGGLLYVDFSAVASVTCAAFKL